MSTRVYVELLDQRTPAWRPVDADEVSPGEYILTFDPAEGEQPAFQPGQRVRCEHITMPGSGKRVLAAVENVAFVPTLRVVPGRNGSRCALEVRSIEEPKSSGRPDLDEPFVMWIIDLSRMLFPVRRNDDPVITNFHDLTDRTRYRVALEVAPGVSPHRAAEFLIASSERYGFDWQVELPREG